MNREENLECIHYVAERFLADYEANQAQEFTTVSIECGMLQVILVRSDRPEYFCGFKNNDTKRPVWSHDRKYAKSIDFIQFEAYARYWPVGHVFAIWNGVSLNRRLGAQIR